MKLLSELPIVGNTGTVKLSINDVEDFWVLANLIRKGDHIFTQIRRKIVKIADSGKTDAKQRLLKAAVKVTEVDFQPYVEEMMVRGTLAQDIDGAKKGDFQRVLLGLGRPLELTKYKWDSFCIGEISKACDPTAGSTVSAVIMQNGISHVCIIGKNMSVTVGKAEKVIPKVRKFGSSSKHSESKIKFFELTANLLIQKIEIDKMKSIIVASPGFLQHEFVQYLSENRAKFNLNAAFQANKFIEGNVPTGHPCELDNLLASPQIARHVENLGVVEQAKVFDSFLRTFNSSPQKVVIGHEQVVKAGNEGALETILVTNDFILRLEFDVRMQFLEFKEQMEKSIKVIVFSISHQSGEQLNSFGGIVGISRFDRFETATFD